MFTRQILVLIVSLSVALAHPLAFHKQARDAVPGIQTREIPSEFQALFDGNQQFRASIASSQQPNLLKVLTDEGQGKLDVTSPNRVVHLPYLLSQRHRLCSWGALIAESAKARSSAPSPGLCSVSATSRTSSTTRMLTRMSTYH